VVRAAAIDAVVSKPRVRRAGQEHVRVSPTSGDALELQGSSGYFVRDDPDRVLRHAEELDVVLAEASGRVPVARVREMQSFGIRAFGDANDLPRPVRPAGAATAKNAFVTMG
jgi:hypothetical protein